MHDVTNEAKSAGTEIQRALGPTALPKSTLKREPIRAASSPKAPANSTRATAAARSGGSGVKVARWSTALAAKPAVAAMREILPQSRPVATRVILRAKLWLGRARLLTWRRGALQRPPVVYLAGPPHPARPGGGRISRVAAERARGARRVPAGAAVHRGAHADHARPAGQPRRGGGGGHPAQPGRHPRQRGAADLLRRPRRQRAARAAHRGRRHPRPARGGGEPGGAGARRLLAAPP